MIKIEPIFLEKIWGGDSLSKKFKFDKKTLKNIGEAWLVSAQPKYESKVTYKGKSYGLQEFYKSNKNLFNNYKSSDFPLLAKFIDANDWLSVQVHPNDEYAQKVENEPFGKSEAWYVIDAKENAKLNIGLKTTSKDEFVKMVDAKKINDSLNWVDVKPGDAFDILAGTVHAIGPGIVVYEIQQSSDITYRLYDYERLENGKPRETHVKKALDSIDYSIQASSARSSKPVIFSTSYLVKTEIIANRFFHLEKWAVSKELALPSVRISESHNFLLVTLISGSLTINDTKLEIGQSGIVTSDELEKLYIVGNGELLVAYPK